MQHVVNNFRRAGKMKIAIEDRKGYNIGSLRGRRFLIREG